MRRTAVLVVLVIGVLAGCAGRDCCCPRPAPSEAVVAPEAAPRVVASPDVAERTALALQGAEEAWTDEITEGTKWLAGCLKEAAEDPDVSARERRHAACIAQFKARIKANDETYEQVKAIVGK